MAIASRVKFAVIAFFAVNAQAFDLVSCMATQSKEECRRELLINDEKSQPLASGDEISGVSGKYTITIKGDDWLRNGWGSRPDQAKDLGIIKGNGAGMMYYELTSVSPEDFEKTITDDMKSIYDGLTDGFRKGKIGISKHSEIELLPLTIGGGTGTLGRFCYTINIKTVKPVCVYEGFMNNNNGEVVKLTGSIGDYDDLRSQIENIITSFKFK